MSRRGAGAARPTRERLALLRAELARQELTGFLVPRADEHQNEYVPPRAQRLGWLTGFSGSAGIAVVLREQAAIFVDGRYTLQVKSQVPAELFEQHHVTASPLTGWLRQHLRAGDRLGYDPWLHTAESAERLAQVCRKAGAELVAVRRNPLDLVWADQPAPPQAPVVPHDPAYAGRGAEDKRREIAAALARDGVDAAVLTAPDSIAWLLNIRGGDVAHTPLPLGFAMIHRDATVDLFMASQKLGPETRAHLGAEVRVSEPAALGDAVDRLGAARRTVQIDPAITAAWIVDRLASAGAEVTRGADPCALPRAQKNAVELSGAVQAHLRDGAALCRFLAWLARTAPGGDVREVAAAERLDAFRAEQPLFREPSFPTISASGPNGAIVHYRATVETDRRLLRRTLYLVDSGGQYLDGTTDVTRTIAIGGATREQKDRFTRVLRGHIALATARFPRGTTGSQLDGFARRPLWDAGLDYDHGTGHGVGSYLGVHEGPQRISKTGSTVALEPGMIVSNEPGYYKTGEYGIRIESLVVVTPVDAGGSGADGPLALDTITMAPIDLALVLPSLLAPDEVRWLDAYHARVRDAIAPLVDAETATWLEAATRPLRARRRPRSG